MMTWKKTLKRGLLRDQSGTAVMEFGLIAIPFSLLLMGTFDSAYSYYVKSVLSGEMNRLARDSALEGASISAQQSALDQRIFEAVKGIAGRQSVLLADCPTAGQAHPASYVCIDRVFYKTFSKAAAAQAETLVIDLDGDGYCDVGDRYVDENGNNHWDVDGGDHLTNGGQGNARDVVIVNVKVGFKRIFPVGKLMRLADPSTAGISDEQILVSDSILANQPFGLQSQVVAQQRNCT